MLALSQEDIEFLAKTIPPLSNEFTDQLLEQALDI